MPLSACVSVCVCAPLLAECAAVCACVFTSVPDQSALPLTLPLSLAWFCPSPVSTFKATPFFSLPIFFSLLFAVCASPPPLPPPPLPLLPFRILLAVLHRWCGHLAHCSRCCCCDCGGGEGGSCLWYSDLCFAYTLRQTPRNSAFPSLWRVGPLPHSRLFRIISVLVLPFSFVCLFVCSLFSTVAAPPLPPVLSPLLLPTLRSHRPESVCVRVCDPASNPPPPHPLASSSPVNTRQAKEPSLVCVCVNFCCALAPPSPPLLDCGVGEPDRDWLVFAFVRFLSSRPHHLRFSSPCLFDLLCVFAFCLCAGVRLCASPVPLPSPPPSTPPAVACGTHAVGCCELEACPATASFGVRACWLCVHLLTCRSAFVFFSASLLLLWWWW